MMPLRFACEEGGKRLTTPATPSLLPQKTKNENLAEKLGLSRQDLEHVVIVDLILKLFFRIANLPHIQQLVLPLQSS